MGEVQSQKIIVLPNNRNIILTANQAKDLSPKQVNIIPTKTMPQGIAALIAFNYEGTLDENLKSMEEAVALVKTIEITRAIRTTKIKGLQIKEGQAIGIIDDQDIIAAGDNVNDILFESINKAGAKSSEVITVYYGIDIEQPQAETIVKQIQKDYPDKPIFLLGHSMGSTIALLIEDHSSFNGLVLSASGMKTGGSVPSILIKLSALFAKIIPKLKVSTSIKGEDLSRDPEVGSSYMKDPLVYKSATVRLGSELFKAVEKTHSLLPNINISCMVISGENDSLMLGAKEVYANIGSQDKSLYIIEGARHEVFNEIEPSKTEALNFLLNFLHNHL